MRYAHEVGNVRAAEQALMSRLPDGVLMQRAAAGLATVCTRILPRTYGARVVVLAGSGDNGGDALYAGARLARRGARVRAVLVGSKVHEGGLAALRRAGGRVTATAGEDSGAEIDAAELILDGLVGIGGSGGLREPYARVAGQAAESVGTVVAVDVPSGVDASTGEVAGTAVRADVTVTFGTWKPGLLVDPGASCAGTAELVDIGLAGELPDPDVAALQHADVRALLPRPVAESDKYRRGVAGIVAGGEYYVGAPALSVGGAVRGGAGMVRFASTQRPVELVRTRWPEVVTTVATSGDEVLAAGRVQAWAAGPGIGTDSDGAAAGVLRAILSTEVPVLVDADGITLLSQRPEWLTGRAAPTVLTPHAGELARLLGTERADVEARRLEHVRRAAERFGHTVLLKGSTTLVASPGRVTRVNPTGTPWLATAGSGDVLSGLGGTLLAGGLGPHDAAAVAAYLHGLAARLAAGVGSGAAAPIAAHDVVEALPDAFRAVEDAGR